MTMIDDNQDIINYNREIVFKKETVCLLFTKFIPEIFLEEPQNGHLAAY